MAKDEIHKGDIGTVFRATIKDGTSAVDVSSATTKTLIFQKPDDQYVEQSAAFTSDGTDGQIQYTTTATTDLDVTGDWKIQAYIVMSSWTGHSDIGTFEVHDNLKERLAT